MAIDTTRHDISKENYMLAAGGALAGGVGSAGVINARLNSLSKKTVQALNGNATGCDTFVKKHANMLSRAVDSKRGFFGKVNKALKGITGSANGDFSQIKQCTDGIIDGYTNKAAKKIGATTLSGDKATNGIIKLRNKILSKDILKSLKDASKFENIVKVSGAAIAGVMGAFIIKEIITKHAENKANAGQEVKPENKTKEAPKEKAEAKTEGTKPESKANKAEAKKETSKKEETKKAKAEDTEPKLDTATRRKLAKESVVAADKAMKEYEAKNRKAFANLTTAEINKLKEQERKKRLEEEMKKRGLN